MAKPALDITAEIARLESLSIDLLREEWRRLMQTPPPMRLSRDTLLRGITYKLQENAFGGLSKATRRKLQSARPADALPVKKRRPRVSFNPGTRLVREWHGVKPSIAHPGGKLGVIIDRLAGKTGATADELVAATGWQRHSVLGALSRLRARGLAVRFDAHADRKAYWLDVTSKSGVQSRARG